MAMAAATADGASAVETLKGYKRFGLPAAVLAIIAVTWVFLVQQNNALHYEAGLLRTVNGELQSGTCRITNAPLLARCDWPFPPGIIGRNAVVGSFACVAELSALRDALRSHENPRLRELAEAKVLDSLWRSARVAIGQLHARHRWNEIS